MFSADNDGSRILSHAPPPADARLAYGGDPNQFGDLRLPKSVNDAPLLMFIHGGYWRARYDLAHAGHLCAALAAAGMATFNIEYRRVGNAGGGWPGTFEDIESAWNFAKRELALKYGVHPVWVAGHSAGGALALWLASRDPKLKAVASLAGVIDLQRAWELHLSNDAVVELLGGTPQQVAEHYAEADPMRLNVRTRQLLIHGDRDSIVPPDFSARYAQQKHAELILLAGAGHFDLIDPHSRHWPKVRQALTSLHLPSGL